MGYYVGVDTGGTFTDIVVVDEAGRTRVGKAPTTPPHFSRGVLDAIADAADHVGLSSKAFLGNTRLFAHGTTLATNALITHQGAKVGIITTKGFEDIILIGRIHQKVAGLSEAEITDMVRLDKPEPLVPRPLIEGVTERIDCQGEEVVPLNRVLSISKSETVWERTHG